MLKPERQRYEPGVSRISILGFKDLYSRDLIRAYSYWFGEYK